MRNFIFPLFASLIISFGAMAQSVEIDADTGILNVSEDTTPQLGGDLDLNGNNITEGDIQLTSAGYLYDVSSPQLDIALGSGVSTYTLTLAHHATDINFTSSDTTVIVPDNIFAAGDFVRVNMDSSALVYISAASGITTDQVIATDATPQLREKGSSAIIEFKSADSGDNTKYRITGDLVQN